MIGRHAPIILSVLALAACQPKAAQEAAAPQAAPAQAAASGQPVNADPRVATYVCEDGSSVEAGYPDPQTAIVKYKDHAYTLKQAISASGARYVGMGLQWWTKGMTLGSLAVLKPGETIASAASVECAVPVDPPEPGTPGGLPDDRTPISEAPFTPQSAQGAANVVQTYYAHVEMRKYDLAAQLRSDGKPEDFSGFALYHAQVGAPGQIEGAAGSLYVDVPVVIYGRLKTGEEYHRSGKAVLRRVNDVPGSTAEQRQWRIAQIDLKP